ncbi:hypothetical protein FPV67DRAFT_391133 [Lyophyllum atratum]|nr:hypothetical protein FPV67DRAFT_391133 [Lyophyllum atratum]
MHGYDLSHPEHLKGHHHIQSVESQAAIELPSWTIFQDSGNNSEEGSDIDELVTSEQDSQKTSGKGQLSHSHKKKPAAQRRKGSETIGHIEKKLAHGPLKNSPSRLVITKEQSGHNAPQVNRPAPGAYSTPPPSGTSLWRTSNTELQLQPVARSPLKSSIPEFPAVFTGKSPPRDQSSVEPPLDGRKSASTSTNQKQPPKNVPCALGPTLDDQEIQPRLTDDFASVISSGLEPESEHLSQIGNLQIGVVNALTTGQRRPTPSQRKDAFEHNAELKRQAPSYQQVLPATPIPQKVASTSNSNDSVVKAQERHLSPWLLNTEKHPEMNIEIGRTLGEDEIEDLFEADLGKARLEGERLPGAEVENDVMRMTLRHLLLPKKGINGEHIRDREGARNWRAVVRNACKIERRAVHRYFGGDIRTRERSSGTWAQT